MARSAFIQGVRYTACEPSGIGSDRAQAVEHSGLISGMSRAMEAYVTAEQGLGAGAQVRVRPPGFWAAGPLAEVVSGLGDAQYNGVWFQPIGMAVVNALAPMVERNRLEDRLALASQASTAIYEYWPALTALRAGGIGRTAHSATALIRNVRLPSWIARAVSESAVDIVLGPTARLQLRAAPAASSLYMANAQLLSQDELFACLADVTTAAGSSTLGDAVTDSVAEVTGEDALFLLACLHHPVAVSIPEEFTGGFVFNGIRPSPGAMRLALSLGLARLGVAYVDPGAHAGPRSIAFDWEASAPGLDLRPAAHYELYRSGAPILADATSAMENLATTRKLAGQVYRSPDPWQHGAASASLASVFGATPLEPFSALASAPRMAAALAQLPTPVVVATESYLGGVGAVAHAALACSPGFSAVAV